MAASFNAPETARVLARAGVTVIGHDFAKGADDREHLVLVLDSVVGSVRLTDGDDGALDVTFGEGVGVEALADELGVDDPIDLGSALDDMLTSATTSFRAGLREHKHAVAAEVVDGIAVDMAGLTPDTT